MEVGYSSSNLISWKAVNIISIPVEFRLFLLVILSI